MPTNVPPLIFGPTGVVAPTDSEILAGVIADYQEAFDSKLNLSVANPSSLSTPQGQLATSTAALVAEANENILFQSTQTDPAFAEGRWQDAIGRIYFIERFPAEPTILQVDCVGLEGVSIPIGATIVDANDNLYRCTQAGAIPSGGSITLPFAAAVPGPIAVPAAASIYQAIPGWDSVSVVSGVIGQKTETKSQFEARRVQSVAKNAVGILSAVRGAVLAVPGVLDAYVTENDAATPQVVGGVMLAANSLYVAASGGDATAIAQAIWSKKSPGCAYNGNTQVTVVDDSSGYSPPFPSYVVSFEIPTSLAILFGVSIANGPQVPADAATQIQNAIIAAFSGSDGGARASIGTTLYASRFVTSVVLLGPWVQLNSLLIGSNNAPGAVVNGSISGTTMSVTSVVSGALAAGQTVSDAAGDITIGTTIAAQIGGTPGGIGTYRISNSMTVSSTTIDAATPTGNFVSVRINQEPTISAANIAVSLV